MATIRIVRPNEDASRVIGTLGYWVTVPAPVLTLSPYITFGWLGLYCSRYCAQSSISLRLFSNMSPRR